MSETPDFDTKARERDTAIPMFKMEVQQGAPVDGKPTFNEVEMVEILVPADRNSAWYGRVTDEHRHVRFPKQYAAWKAGQEAPTTGTPLSQVAWLTRSQVEELAFNHVKTVEQLAELSDQGLQNAVRMGGHALREKAQRHLQTIAGAAPNEKLAAENAELKANMDVMKGQMDDLMKRLDEMNAQKTAAPEVPPAA